MRRFLFWHQHSSSRFPSPTKTNVPTRRFRRLAFQLLERRDLKAADTTSIIAVAQPPSTTPTGAEIAQALAPAQCAAFSDTTQIPADSATSISSGPQDVNLGQAIGADIAATTCGASTPANQQVGSLPTVASNIAGPRSDAVTARASSGTQVTPETDVASRQSDPSALQSPPSAKGQDSSGAQTKDTSNGPATQSTAAVAPSKALATVQSPTRQAASSTASGGAAGGSTNAAITADATTSQDGYGGSANGYGGDAGYGGPTDGYGGSAPRVDNLSVSDTPTDMTFTGQVSGEANLAGSTVTFGGQLAGYTTTVGSDNSFQLVLPISPPIEGTVTVQITDANGVTSNIITIYVS